MTNKQHRSVEIKTIRTDVYFDGEQTILTSAGKTELILHQLTSILILYQ